MKLNTASKSEDCRFVQDSPLYQEYLAEREEVLKHKWIESEKTGYDIGFEKALLDWILNHRTNWRAARRGQINTALSNERKKTHRALQ